MDLVVTSIITALRVSVLLALVLLAGEACSTLFNIH